MWELALKKIRTLAQLDLSLHIKVVALVHQDMARSGQTKYLYIGSQMGIRLDRGNVA